MSEKYSKLDIRLNIWLVVYTSILLFVFKDPVYNIWIDPLA